MFSVLNCKVVHQEGFEPSTKRLRGACSTAELLVLADRTFFYTTPEHNCKNHMRKGNSR